MSAVEPPAASPLAAECLPGLRLAAEPVMASECLPAGRWAVEPLASSGPASGIPRRHCGWRLNRWRRRGRRRNVGQHCGWRLRRRLRRGWCRNVCRHCGWRLHLWLRLGWRRNVCQHRAWRWSRWWRRTRRRNVGQHGAWRWRRGQWSNRRQRGRPDRCGRGSNGRDRRFGNCRVVVGRGGGRSGGRRGPLPLILRLLAEGHRFRRTNGWRDWLPSGRAEPFDCGGSGRQRTADLLRSAGDSLWVGKPGNRRMLAGGIGYGAASAADGAAAGIVDGAAVPVAGNGRSACCGSAPFATVAGAVRASRVGGGGTTGALRSNKAVTGARSAGTSATDAPATTTNAVAATAGHLPRKFRGASARGVAIAGTVSMSSLQVTRPASVHGGSSRVSGVTTASTISTVRTVARRLLPSATAAVTMRSICALRPDEQRTRAISASGVTPVTVAPTPSPHPSRSLARHPPSAARARPSRPHR